MGCFEWIKNDEIFLDVKRDCCLIFIGYSNGVNRICYEKNIILIIWWFVCFVFL